MKIKPNDWLKLCGLNSQYGLKQKWFKEHIRFKTGFTIKPNIPSDRSSIKFSILFASLLCWNDCVCICSSSFIFIYLFYLISFFIWYNLLQFPGTGQICIYFCTWVKLEVLEFSSTVIFHIIFFLHLYFWGKYCTFTTLYLTLAVIVTCWAERVKG